MAGNAVGDAGPRAGPVGKKVLTRRLSPLVLRRDWVVKVGKPAGGHVLFLCVLWQRVRPSTIAIPLVAIVVVAMPISITHRVLPAARIGASIVMA